MLFNEIQVLPPKSWEKFEDLCLDLFAAQWADPTAQKNGRRGQPQHGTDVWGMPAAGGGGHIGVQCKGKDTGFGAVLTEKELRAEVEKAKLFRPGLTHWILATTGQKDSLLEEVSRTLTAEHLAVGLFRVQVLGWADLQNLLCNHIEVVEKYYPDESPRIRRTLQRIEARLDLDDQQPALNFDKALATTRNAAADDLRRLMRDVRPEHLIDLNLERAADRTTEPIQRQHVIATLRTGNMHVLAAEPGAGKSTTLLQLAIQILSDTTDLVPVLFRLLERGTGQSILAEIADRPAFKAAGGALAAVAQAGQLVVLCDGWNEISSEDRIAARIELVKHARNYAGGLLLATRALSPMPFPLSSRLFLSPLTRAQQQAILTAHLGDKGPDLLLRARRVPGLRDALQMPLYVSALAKIGADGVLPGTKEQVVSRFIQSHEQDPRHGEVLHRELKDCHRAYLRRLAVHLMQVEGTAVADTALRPLLAETSRELAAEGNISAIPEPAHVLDVLVSHHVLVEREGGERLFSFQHQQFQEWYASFWVEEIFLAAARGEPPAQQQRDTILNRQPWEEALLFAIERLSRADDRSADACASAILRTLGIDPMLAAEMMQRAGGGIWPRVADSVLQFATTWFATAEADRAALFMIKSGRPEFAHTVWGVLQNPRASDRLVLHRVRFPPSVLGDDWSARLARLPTESRRVLLWDIVDLGSQDGVDFTIAALKQETSIDVIASVLELLEYRATDSEIADVLQNASPELWQHLAQRRRLEDFREAFRPRLQLEKQKLAAALPAGAEKTRLLIDLGQQAQSDDVDTAIANALDAKFTDYHAEQRTFSELAEHHPTKLSVAIIDRLISNKPVNRAAGRYARPQDVTDPIPILQIATNSAHKHSGQAEVAARLLGTSSTRALIVELLELKRGQSNQQGKADRVSRDRSDALFSALHHVPINILASNLCSMPFDHPVHVAVLGELLSRSRDESRDDSTLPLSEGLAAELCGRLKEWVQLAINHPEMRRYHLCSLATAVKALARPELLPTLKILLDKDLATWRIERAEFSKNRQERRLDHTSDARMGYVLMYQQAFAPFHSEAARDVLLGYLDDPDFGGPAAFALLQFGSVRPLPAAAQVFGRPKYEQIAQARAARIAASGSGGLLANAILDRVDSLIAQGDPPSMSRALGMATAAAQMDYGSRNQAFHALLDTSGPFTDPLVSQHSLLRCLLFNGEEIKSEWITRGLERAIQALASSYGNNHDRWWTVRQWLELFAFTSRPQDMLARIPDLPAYFKYDYQISELVHALSFSQGDAIGTLKGLIELCPAILSRHEWTDVLSRVGTEAAAHFAVDIIFDDAKVLHFGGNEFYMITALSPLLEKHPIVMRDLLTRLHQEHSPASRRLVAGLIGEGVDAETLFALLEIAEPGPSDPIGSALLKVVEELALTKRPIEGHDGAYEQEPAELGQLRARLFYILCGAGHKATLAGQILMEIERHRDEYGRPLSEPRHPDIASGFPWPAAAEAAWKDTRPPSEPGLGYINFR